MSSPAIPPSLQNPDLADAYKQVYDALGTAYWDASDMANKDLIHGTQEAIGQLITALNGQGLAANTDAFLTLTPKVKAVNNNLKEIVANISQITKNIDTVSSVLAAANKILSLLPL